MTSCTNVNGSEYPGVILARGGLRLGLPVFGQWYNWFNTVSGRSRSSPIFVRKWYLPQRKHRRWDGSPSSRPVKNLMRCAFPASPRSSDHALGPKRFNRVLDAKIRDAMSAASR
jgi:hypothetical protein